MLNFDEPFFNVVAEVKKVQGDVLGPGTNLVVRLGHFNTCRVVFKGMAENLRFREGNWEVASMEFQKKVLEVDEFNESSRQSNQLSLRTTECTSDCILEPHTMGQLVRWVLF